MSKPQDIIAATIPTVATITLGQVNDILGTIGAVLGIAYLLWKWMWEAKQHKNPKI